jgi:thiamine-phosphate diphosphorylase
MVMTPSRLLVLTDRSMCAIRGRTVQETVGEAIAGGARAILLREKDLPWRERLTLGESLVEALRRRGGRLIVASDVALAIALDASVVHLAAGERMPRGTSLRFGRSCHGADDVRQASRDDALYATISPIFATSSKPGYGPALTVSGLRRISAITPLPLHALGGVVPHRARACLDAGAHGVAVMGAVMSARDPAAVTAQFVTALAAAGGCADPRG